jgi:hypothetical protein
MYQQALKFYGECKDMQLPQAMREVGFSQNDDFFIAKALKH